MMIFAAITLLVGSLGILQGGFNKQMSMNIGVAHAILIGGLLTFLFSIVLYLTVKFSPNLFPELFHLKTGLESFRPRYIIPAICGMGIISLMPFLISKIGAVNVTIFIIAGQIITSIIWDIFVEKIPLHPMKIMGLVLAASSVALISYSNYVNQQ